jgi:hypothetical protein
MDSVKYLNVAHIISVLKSCPCKRTLRSVLFCDVEASTFAGPMTLMTVRMSALRASSLLLQEYSWYPSYRLSHTQGRSAPGRIRLIEKCNRPFSVPYNLMFIIVLFYDSA